MTCKQIQAGFSLVELVIVIVVVGVMSVYAAARNVSSAEVTLPSQAQKMASDIRHMQTLATAWGRRLSLSVAAGANGVYSVSCAVSGATPCDVSPVIDPATGSSFSVTVQKGVVLAGSALYVNSLGQPSDSSGVPIASVTTYTLSSGGSTETISMAALSGLLTVTP